MTFECSFGGVAICLDTPEAKTWIGQHIPLDDVRITTPERAWPGTKLLGLTYPFRQPTRPDLRLGQWFYPTSASRWAEFHALVTETQYQALLPLAFTTAAQPQTFTMQQGTTTISTDLYLLPPRPLAKFGTLDGLYLCSFVDERYLWQHFHGGDLSDLDDTWTWDELITVLADTLGVVLDIPTAIESVYGQPHPDSDLSSRYESAPLLLDACLWNVGRTLVRNLDGSYSALRFSESQATATSNKLTYQLAGGDFVATGGNTPSVLMPSHVTVTFPKRLSTTGAYVNTQPHVPYQRTQGDVLTVTVSIDDAGYSKYTGVEGEKVFHDTAEAWLLNADDTVASNASDISALALQLAQDFYEAQVEGLDIVYPSVVAWEPEGIHDVIWSWASDRCSTRVQRKPYNFGVEEMLHHWPGVSSSSSGSGGTLSGPCIQFLADVAVTAECVDGVITTTTQKTFKYYYPETGAVSDTACSDPQ